MSAQGQTNPGGSPSVSQAELVVQLEAEVASLRQRVKDLERQRDEWKLRAEDAEPRVERHALATMKHGDPESLRTQLQQAEQESERARRASGALIDDLHSQLLQAEQENERLRELPYIEIDAEAYRALHAQLQQAETALRDITDYDTGEPGAEQRIARDYFAAPPPNPKEAGNAVLGILIALAISLVLWALFARIAIALHDAFGGVL